MATALEDLLYEVRLLYQSMVLAGDSIHAERGLSMGNRAILEFLDRHGPTTVPDIGRARRVTRQRIQTLVNPLIAEALVESMPNPASKRSPLMRLTRGGKRCIDEMRRVEGSFFQTGTSNRKLVEAKATLAQIRKEIEQNAIEDAE